MRLNQIDATIMMFREHRSVQRSWELELIDHYMYKLSERKMRTIDVSIKITNALQIRLIKL